MLGFSLMIFLLGLAALGAGVKHALGMEFEVGRFVFMLAMTFALVTLLISLARSRRIAPRF